MELIVAASTFLGLIVLFAGGVLTVFGLRSAPEGFEDETGFHVIESQREATRDDVPCVGSDTVVPF